MNKLGWLCVTLAAVCAAPVWAVSDPEACTAASASQFMCSLGDRDPYPFGAMNQRAELASGEVYQLTGRIVILGGRPVLEIDFCSHPWLASASRRAFPYYYLDTSQGFNWDSYVTRKITLLYRAKGRVELSQGNTGRYTLLLSPLTAPDSAKP